MPLYLHGTHVLLLMDGRDNENTCVFTAEWGATAQCLVRRSLVREDMVRILLSI